MLLTQLSFLLPLILGHVPRSRAQDGDSWASDVLRKRSEEKPVGWQKQERAGEEAQQDVRTKVAAT